MDIKKYLETTGTVLLTKEAFDELIERAARTEWVPLSEQLPEDGTWNLFTDGENMSVERYKADSIDHFFPEGRWFQLEQAVAWMPLPKKYKEGETEK